MKHRIKKSPFAICLLIALFVYSIIILLPFVWSLIASLKTRLGFIDDPFGLPKKWMFVNYSDAFRLMTVSVPWGNLTRTIGLPEMMLNSVLYSAGTAFVNAFMIFMTAYLTAKYDFKMSRIVYTTVVIVMILPIVGSLPSQLEIARALGLYDKMIGMYIMSAGFTGIYYLIAYAQFRTISPGYSDAAFVDGASHLTVMLRIIFPLVKNMFMVVFLLAFISKWNDYTTPMLFLPSSPTAAYGLYLYQFNGENASTSVPMQLSGCMIVMLPTLVLFIIFRNKMMGNLTAGGLKE